MKKQIHLNLDEDLHRALENYARRKGVTVTYAIRKAVRRLLDDHKNEEIEDRIRRAVSAAMKGDDF